MQVSRWAEEPSRTPPEHTPAQCRADRTITVGYSDACQASTAAMISSSRLRTRIHSSE
jgi:hypothetical protein